MPANVIPIEPPLLPLNDPRMRPMGPAFLLAARDAGDDPPKIVKDEHKRTVLTNPGPELERLARCALYESGFQMEIEAAPGRIRAVEFVAGGLWGSETESRPSRGPQPAEVMVVGKMPGAEELSWHRNLIGPSGQYLRRECENLGLDVTNWYVTNVMRHTLPLPNVDKLKASWLKNCLPLLDQEIRLVQPRFMLLLGREAMEAVLGQKVAMASVSSDRFLYSYQVPGPDDTEEERTAEVGLRQYSFRSDLGMIHADRSGSHLAPSSAFTFCKASSKYLKVAL